MLYSALDEVAEYAIHLAVELVNLDFHAWLSLRAVSHGFHARFLAVIMPTFCAHLRRRLVERVGAPTANQIFTGDRAGTGGFLLDCIYGADNGGDVDILCPWKPNGEYELPPDLVDTMDLDGYVAEKDHFTNTSVPLTFTSRKFFHRVDPTLRAHVDIILCALPPREFVEAYDFDFCKNCFDGRTLKLTFPLSVVAKSADITIDDVRRITQFVNYGNQFGGDSPETIRGYTLARIEKYRSRGFTVADAPSIELYDDLLRNHVISYNESIIKKISCDVQCTTLDDE